MALAKMQQKIKLCFVIQGHFFLEFLVISPHIDFNDFHLLIRLFFYNKRISQ